MKKRSIIINSSLMRCSSIILFIISICIGCSTSFPLDKSGFHTKKINGNLFYCNDSLQFGMSLSNLYDTQNSSDSEISLTNKEKQIFHKLNINPNHLDFLSALNTSNLKSKRKGFLFLNPTIDTSSFIKQNIGSNYYWFKKTLLKQYTVYQAVLKNNQRYYNFLELVTHNTIASENLFKSQLSNSIKRLEKGQYNCEVEASYSVLKDYFEINYNYLTAYNLDYFIKNYRTKSDKNYFKQYLATLYSFAGNSEKALENFKTKKKDTLNFEQLKKITLDTLIKIGKENQVVMYNEAHHIPEHRYLVGKLLKDYYNIGYRYLGLEALWNDSIQHRNYLKQTDGFYTSEPVLSNLIREAHQIGYKTFGYDLFNDINKRELNQAENIVNKTLKNDKHAKILILAGWGHINETKKTMAHQFKIQSHINPYTINQTSLESRFFLKGSNPSELSQINNHPKLKDSDLHIYNNLKIKNNCFSIRPHSNKEINIQTKKLKSNENYALLIYYKTELDQSAIAVPTTVKIVDGKTKSINLNLCEGSYVLKIMDTNGKAIYKEELSV